MKQDSARACVWGGGVVVARVVRERGMDGEESA